MSPWFRAMRLPCRSVRPFGPDGYLDRAFSGSDEKLALAGNHASLALYELMADPAAAFTRRITALIAEVMAEGQNG